MKDQIAACIFNNCNLTAHMYALITRLIHKINSYLAHDPVLVCFHFIRLHRRKKTDLYLSIYLFFGMYEELVAADRTST